MSDTRHSIQAADGPADGARAWPMYLAGAMAMLAVGLACRAEWLTDWDSCDYAAQAIRRQSSDLALGRWWFIAVNRVAWLAGHWAFGLDELSGYLAMQSASLLAMAGAVAMLMAWTRRLTGVSAAAAIASVIVIAGPLMGIYASAVMTEPLALLLIGVAFYAWERAIGSAGTGKWAWTAGAGLAFGVLVDIREPALLLAAWPVVSCLVDKPRGRWAMLAVAALAAGVTLGVGVAMAWAWYPWDRGYWANLWLWKAKMVAERQRFGLSWLMNVAYMGAFVGVAMPLAAAAAVFAAVVRFLRRRQTRAGDSTARPRRAKWVALASMPYAASLMLNHNLDVNPRFVLPLAWMLLPALAGAAGAWAQRARPARQRRRLASVLVAGLAIGGAGWLIGWRDLGHYHYAYTREQKTAQDAMLHLPAGAVVVPGPNTSAAFYLDRMGIRKDLTIIATGWDWPGKDFEPIIERHLAEGRPVYVNADPESWNRTLRESDEWKQVRALIDRQGLAPDAEGLGHFRRVLPTARTTMPDTSPESP